MRLDFDPVDFDTVDFDRVIDRRNTDSAKWRWYGEDVLPLWVADMDFAAPPAVIVSLRERMEHPVYGYAGEPPELRGALVDWLLRRFGWQVAAEAFVFVPGVVSGFNIAVRAVTEPSDGVLVQTPVYYPMLEVPDNFALTFEGMELIRQADGRYVVDTDLMRQTITDRTAAFLLCSPHNPTGRAFTVAELTRMADLCLSRDVVIISDEIHCDLVYREAEHVPIASLSPEVSAKTITLMAPSKTFNIPGLGFSFAIIEDAGLRKAFQAAMSGIVPHVSVFGYVAALAAYTEADDWLDACCAYLERNRDYLADYIAAGNLPGVTMAPPEATYLAWLDCRGLDLDTDPFRFFLKQARVALSNGASFGRGGEGFARLNFGCPRVTLEQALDRMRQALLQHRA